MPNPKEFFRRLLHRSRPSNDETTESESTNTATTSSSLPGNSPPLAQPIAQHDVRSQLAAAKPSEGAEDAGSSETPLPIQQIASLVQPNTSMVPDFPDRGNDIYGLLPINLNAHGLATAEQDPNYAGSVQPYPIDIVAVHGITGDAYNTWTHHNKKLWLRDFLSDDLPGARIFSYGYDASVFFSLSKGGLEEFAETLLGHVKQKRTTEANKTRPLIFICHSMGGIVVKEAIITTLVKGAMYENIRKSCLGIVFLGTPHRGSTVLGFPLLLAAITNVATFGTSRLFGRARTELLKNLEREAPILDSISGKFVEQTRTIKVATFVEMNTTPPSNDRIVDRHSAVMHVVGEQVFDMQGCDHTSICRFPERNGNYGLVLGVLKEWWTEAAPQIPTVQEQLPIAQSISSLKFPEMHDKRLELEDKAHSKTCAWIFGRATYFAWLNNPQGLLWIKGKPGAGKSTIMKKLADHFELQKSSRFIVLVYFFNAFGHPNKHLKNSAAGMYRMLLAQLLEQVPSAAFRFERMYEKRKPVRGRRGQTIEWRDEDQNQLRKVLNAELENLDTTSIKIRILIDAIDEDFQGRAQDIGRYLFDLDNKLRGIGKDVRVCVSCRHFPIAPVPEQHTIVLEKENLDDIRAFVEDEFNVNNILSREILDSDGTLSHLKRQIVDKSAGIFLWVSLVLKIVIDRLNKGDSVQKVMARLDVAPPRLGQIYTDMLSNIIQPEDREDAYSLLEWAAKAKEPMLLARIATEVEFSYPFYISSNDSHDEQNKELQRLGLYVGSYSGGLMEARCHDSQDSCGPVALFIHQTVQTFLRETGLRQLRDQLPIALSNTPSTPDASDEDEDRIGIGETGKLQLEAALKSPTSINRFLSDNSSRSGRGQAQSLPDDEAQSSHSRLVTVPYPTTIVEAHDITPVESQITSMLGLSTGQSDGGKSDSYTPAENSSLLADRWFETFEMETIPLVKSGLDTKRVKIAILDTGVDITHPDLAEKAGGVIHSNSWPTNTASDFSDTEGHGTHVVGLIMKLAPQAEIYIAKVYDNSEAGSNRGIDSRNVAKAIEWAIDSHVDIITMSFGFTSVDANIHSAISRAYKDGIIVFAAASNGNSKSISFPASSSDVICISSADGYGNNSIFNPPLNKGKDNFSVLGEAVESFWPASLGHGPTARKSGTSFATPIAAGIAALVLEFARQNLPANSPELSAVSSPEGMRLLFSYMSSSREGFGYVVPWKLLSSGSSHVDNLRRILRVLKANKDFTISQRTAPDLDRGVRLQTMDEEERDGRSQRTGIYEVDNEGHRI